MTTTLIYDPLFSKHITGNSPECPERYQVIISAVEQDELLWNSLLKSPPRPAAIEDLLRCHKNTYIQKVHEFCAQGGGYIDADTYVSPNSYEIAYLAAGAAITGIDTLFSSKAKNAFSLVRPPGHHATPDKAMGFCLFNNVAIAARYAQHIYGVENILIIDWDVHHGNGTQEIFYQDPSVFYFSIHEYPFYPNTGHATDIGSDLGKNTTLNVPLPGKTPAHIYREAFCSSLKAIQLRFKPDLIIISAGFDAHKEDPLADFLLSTQDFFEMTQEVTSMAEKYCNGRVLSVLEGGYNLHYLGETVRQHIRALQI